jgi:hypothetical protein
MKIDENNIAFLCVLLFFGIGTFQWVTEDSNKKKSPLFGVALAWAGQAGTSPAATRWTLRRPLHNSELPLTDRKRDYSAFSDFGNILLGDRFFRPLRSVHSQTGGAEFPGAMPVRSLTPLC